MLRRLRAGAQDFISHFDLKAIGNDVEKHTDFENCARPVLLIPGFMATRRGLAILERRLRRKGYGVFSLKLGGLLDTFNTRTIEESGFLVHEKIEELYRRHPKLGPLTIIGHSKGGLIGRYYVKRLGGRERVRALITLGTPHHGTPSAWLGVVTMGVFARSVLQFTPMSAFIRRLKQGPFPHFIRFTSIYSRDDNLVPFPMGLIEDQGRPNLRNIEVKGISHHEFLVKKSVFDVVLGEIEAAYGGLEPMVASAAPKLTVVPADQGAEVAQVLRMGSGAEPGAESGDGEKSPGESLVEATFGSAGESPVELPSEKLLEAVIDAAAKAKAEVSVNVAPEGSLETQLQTPVEASAELAVEAVLNEPVEELAEALVEEAGEAPTAKVLG